MKIFKRLFSRKYRNSRDSSKLLINSELNIDEVYENEVQAYQSLCNGTINQSEDCSGPSKNLEISNDEVELPFEYPQGTEESNDYLTQTNNFLTIPESTGCNMSKINLEPLKKFKSTESDKEILNSDGFVNNKKSSKDKSEFLIINDSKKIDPDENVELSIIIKELNRIILERETLRKKLDNKNNSYKIIKKKLNQLMNNKLYKPIKIAF